MLVIDNAVFFSYFIIVYASLLNTSESQDIWYPKNANRSYLICPDGFSEEDDPAKKQRWCICHSEPVWSYMGDKTVHLDLEYTNRAGESVVLHNGYPNDIKNSYLTLIHNNGFMTKIPNNICAFDRLVTMDLSFNRLSEVGNISCLVMLDVLDLSNNQIKHISNQTFRGLMNLRVLTIKSNGLKTLDPETLQGDSVQIFKIDFSDNKLEVMEVSNMISESDFCEIKVSGNNIKELVNTNGFTLDPRNKKYHGGFVDLEQNNLTKFIDFGKLGLTDLSLLSGVFKYNFVMKDIKLDCDCSLEPFLELSEKVLYNIWEDCFDIKCWNPPEYRGKTVVNFVNEGHLDLLICNVSESCPRNCHCYQQPKERRSVVNCTNANLNRLPDKVPEGSNLSLILTNNSIETFEYRPYLHNTSVLDLSGNSISRFEKNATSALKPSINLNLANNSFTELPQEFQTLDPCSSHFGEIRIKCDCNSAWLKLWSEKGTIKNCKNISSYICQTENGDIPIENVNKNDICKEEESFKSIYFAIIFGLCSTLLLGSTLSAYSFRYELYLIQRKYRYRFLKSKQSKVEPLVKYDAFLSFNEENYELRFWILNVLVKNLESAGYRLFVPCRDLPLGSIKEETILDHILNSRNSIVVLCDYYKQGRTQWTKIEWKYIWYNFLDILDRKVIVVNFDQLDTFDDMDKRLRAFVRLNYDIDFSNRNHDLITKIKFQLGQPLIATWPKKNPKVRFDIGHLNKKHDTAAAYSRCSNFDTPFTNDTVNSEISHNESININIHD